MWKIERHLLESVIEHSGFSDRKGVSLFSLHLHRQWILILTCDSELWAETVVKGDRFVSTSCYFFYFHLLCINYRLIHLFFWAIELLDTKNNIECEVIWRKRIELRLAIGACVCTNWGLRRVLITLDASTAARRWIWNSSHMIPR